MKSFVLLALALLGTGAFAAPVKPDQSVVDQIQSILDLREAAANHVKDLALRKKKVEQDIGLRDDEGRPIPPRGSGLEEYARGLLGLDAANFEKYAGLTREYQSAQEEVRALSEQAIKMATDAYRPTPRQSEGEIVSGPPLPATNDDIPGFIGKHATYAPVFSERVPDGTWGSTDDAGKVLIGADAFGSPGKLAFTLYHEGEHFERLLTPGLDLRNTPSEEVHARPLQRPLLKRTFDLSDEDIARFDEVLKSEKIRALKWDALISQGLNPYKKSQQAAFPGNLRPLWLEDGALDEVDRIIAKAGELRDQETRDRADAAAREREARRNQAALNQLEAAAAACGYTLQYQENTGKFMGFAKQNMDLILWGEYVPLTVDDFRIGLLVHKPAMRRSMNSSIRRGRDATRLRPSCAITLPAPTSPRSLIIYSVRPTAAPPASRGCSIRRQRSPIPNRSTKPS